MASGTLRLNGVDVLEAKVAQLQSESVDTEQHLLQLSNVRPQPGWFDGARPVRPSPAAAIRPEPRFRARAGNDQALKAHTEKRHPPPTAAIVPTSAAAADNDAGQNIMQELHDIGNQINSLKQQISGASISDNKPPASRRILNDVPANSRPLQLQLNTLSADEEPNAQTPRGDRQRCSMISFSSSMDASGSADGGVRSGQPSQRADFGQSLLSLVSSRDRLESSETLVLMSRSADTCELLRQSGCAALVVQLLHPGDVWSRPPSAADRHAMQNAAEALRNMAQWQSDESRRQREMRILQLLETVREYAFHLRLVYCGLKSLSEGFCAQEVSPSMSMLMKYSFDEVNRRVTAQLGGVEAIAELLVGDQLVFGEKCGSVQLRRYAGMALTNLTFGDRRSKQTLCAFPRFLHAVNAQIESSSDELRQSYASVLRNLSWKADMGGKEALRDSGAVVSLVAASVKSADNEATLKSVLSALWNLSAHCSENKLQICRAAGSLEFLVATLAYRSATNSLAVVENGSGILRNISSQIALSEQWRAVLRRCDCYPILLKHLRSSSLTVVSNACGTLWNLSARSADDQRLLCELGAVPMLHRLIYSKHRLIMMGSASALKNLLNSTDCTDKGFESASLMPQRQRRLLENEVEEQLARACPSSSEPFGSGASVQCSPSKQVMQLVGHLGRHRQSHAQSVPPDATVNAPKCVQQSASATNVAAAPMTASKEERMLFDKYSVQRYHNSLRRQKHKDFNGDGTSKDNQLQGNGQEDTDEVKVYGSLESDRITKSTEPSTDRRCVLGGSNAAFYRAAKHDDANTDSVRMFCVEGTPRNTSHKASKEDLRLAECNAPTAIALLEAAVSPKDAPPTGDAKSTAIGSPMMMSRHSSAESLESGSVPVRSEVPSVYSSRFATGAVSPSDLPDSPGGSLPPSPSAKPATAIGLSRVRDGSSTEITCPPLKAATASPPRPSDTVTYDDEPEYATFDAEKAALIFEASLETSRPAPTKRTTPRSGCRSDRPKANVSMNSSPAAPIAQSSLAASPGRSYHFRSTEIKPRAIAHPIMRNAATTATTTTGRSVETFDAVEQTREFAVEGTPRTRSRTASPRRSERGARRSPSREQPSYDRSLLPQFISDAMPKPKPKSKANTPAGKVRRSSGQPFNRTSPDKLATTMSAVEAPMSGNRRECDAAVSTTSDALMGASGMSTAIDNIEPPDEMLLLSAISNGSFVQSASTCEKVKDASELLPRAAVSAAPLVSKVSSDGSDCLSEDNYSHPGEPFDIAPEDIDLELLENDVGDLFGQLERAAAAAAAADDAHDATFETICSEELLIDCETLSLQSAASDSWSVVDESQQPRGPTIAKREQPPPKTVKGGTKRYGMQHQRQQNSSTPPPKVAVRTTKTAQLRAQRTVDGDPLPLDRASSSPRGGRPKVKADVKRQTPPLSKEPHRSVPPPPVPPKPRIHSATQLHSIAAEQALKHTPTNPSRAPTSKTAPRVCLSSSILRSRVTFQFGTNTNVKSENSAPTATSPKEKPSSKKMIVTTV